MPVIAGDASKLPGASLIETNKDNERSKLLRSISTDDIIRKFQDGDITSARRDQLLSDKAKDEQARLYADNGYASMVYKQMMKHAQDGWNNYLEAWKEPKAESDKSKLNKSVGDILYNAGLLVWGQIQMIFALPNALGEGNRQLATQIALNAGASPGLANLIGIAAEVGTATVPVGKISQTFVKNVQRLTGDATRAAAAHTERIGELSLELAPMEEKVVKQALGESLKMDGSAEAEKLIGEVVVDPAKAPRILTEATKVLTTPFMDHAIALSKRITSEEASKALPALYAKLGLDPNILKIPGNVQRREHITDRQMYGYLTAIEEQSATLGDLARKALEGAPEDAVNFGRFVSQLFAPGEKFRNSEVMNDILMHWDPEAIANNNVVGALRTFAENMARLTPAQTAKFTINNQQGFLNMGVNWWGITKELYANMLLPMSWASATVGNTISTGLHFANTFAGAAFSADKNAGLVWSEGVYAAKGLTLAIGDALQAVKQALLEQGPISQTRLDLERVIPTIVGQIIRKPTDAVIAADRFFNTILERLSLYQQATRAATHSGLRGGERGAFVNDFTENRWFQSDEVVEEMRALSQTATFQNKLGRLGQFLQGKIQNSPAFFYFPFVKSFVDLTKYSWNQTPGLQFMAGKIYKDIAAGGAKADQVIGRLTISNLIGYYMYELAKEGYITGRGPEDSVQNKAWREAGNEPYSIKTPWGWMSYNNMEPATAPLGFVADMTSISGELDEHTLGQLGMAVTYGIMNNFVNKGAWHSVIGLGDILHSWSSGKLWSTPTQRDALMSPFLVVAPAFKGSIPGPLGKRITDVVDPVQKDTHFFVDSVAARTAWGSKNVAPMRDDYGNIKIPPKSWGSSWFGIGSPLIPRFQSEVTDPVRNEGGRLQAKPPTFPYNVGGSVPDENTSLQQLRPGDRVGTDLTSKEHNEWKGRYNDLVYHKTDGIMEQLVNTPDYQDSQSTPLALKRQQFEGFLRGKKAEAFSQLLEANPDLYKRIIESTIKSQSPLLSPEERAGFKQDMQSVSSQGLGEALFGAELTQTEQENLMKFGDMTLSIEGSNQ